MLQKTFHLGTLGNLKIMAKGSAVISFFVAWLLWTLIWRFALEWSWLTAVTAGLIAVLMHQFSELWHHLSHNFAARRAGWPMSGIMFVWVLAVSLYPPDEPTLPAKIHLQRAFGGPIGSALLTAVAGLLVILAPSGTVLKALLVLLFAENLLIFTLGALLPLSFTDGSTILRYWGKS